MPGRRFQYRPIATAARGVRLEQQNIPVNAPVLSVCEMLGYDPLYLACEGRIVAIGEPQQAPAVLDTRKSQPVGSEAAIIGRMDAALSCVVLETDLGGKRFLEELEDDPLPRIC